MFFLKKHKGEPTNDIVVGGLYLLDRDGILSLREYEPVKVRVLKKAAKNIYTCICVEPIILPTMNDSYPVRLIDVPANFLIPTTEDEKVVIRVPADMPIVKDEDIATLTVALELLRNSDTNPVLLSSLEGLLQKLCFYSSIKKG